MAEAVFYRVLFYGETPEAIIPSGFAEYTAFVVSISKDRVVDITEHPDPSLTQLNDYRATTAYADVARMAGATGIRATSVRCPKKGATLICFSCSFFDRPEPAALQTWHMRLSQSGVQALCESPRIRIEFIQAPFRADPRISDFSRSCEK